ncbi:MAG: hypothetical protein O3A01_07640 [bacterium]|nr:hypothetical protein [bacterium]
MATSLRTAVARIIPVIPVARIIQRTVTLPTRQFSQTVANQAKQKSPLPNAAALEKLDALYDGKDTIEVGGRPVTKAEIMSAFRQRSGATSSILDELYGYALRDSVKVLSDIAQGGNPIVQETLSAMGLSAATSPKTVIILSSKSPERVFKEGALLANGLTPQALLEGKVKAYPQFPGAANTWDNLTPCMQGLIGGTKLPAREPFAYLATAYTGEQLHGVNALALALSPAGIMRRNPIDGGRDTRFTPDSNEPSTLNPSVVLTPGLNLDTILAGYALGKDGKYHSLMAFK